MFKPQVWMLGQDIYDLGYVSQLDNIEEFKTFRKDKLISNQYNLTVKNFDNFFSVDNTSSFFYKIIWLYTPITIYDENEELIWEGILTNIQRNHETKRAILKTKSSLTQIQKQIIDYTSSDWETAGDAFKNICDSISFTNYNESILNNTINILKDASCYIKCRFDTEDGVTFQQAIEKIAEYGACDCYLHLNNIYFVHWIEYTGGVTISLTDKNLNTLPVVEEDQKNIINDYSIGYSGDSGTPATDSNSDNIGQVSRSLYGTQSLPEMGSSDTDSQIQFKDKTSATYIGNRYIIRTNKNYLTQPKGRTKIKFKAFSDIEDYINLQSYFKLTLADESWNEKIFETYKFTTDENLIDIEAYEV